MVIPKSVSPAFLSPARVRAASAPAQQPEEKTTSADAVTLDGQQAHSPRPVDTTQFDQALAGWHERLQSGDSRNYAFVATMWTASQTPYAITDEKKIREDKKDAPGWADQIVATLPRISENVLDMVTSFVGRDSVLKALESGAPRTAAELFSAISNENQDWSKLAQGWLEQSRFPKLSSSLQSSTLHLQQQVFKLYPDEKGEFDHSWDIPIEVKFRDDEGVKSHKLVMKRATQKVDLPAVGKVTWAYPNGGGLGFYRTQMPDSQLDAILNEGWQDLQPEERLAIAGNQWRMVRHGASKVGRFLDIAEKLSKQPCDDTVSLLVTEVQFLRRYQVADGDKEAFDSFARELLAPGLEHVGLESSPGEPEKRTRLRARLLFNLATSGDQRVIEHLQQTDSGLTDQLAGASRDKLQLGRLIQEFEQLEDDYNRAFHLGEAISSSADPGAIDRLLKGSERSKSVSGGVAWGLVSSGTRVARQKAWQHLRQNWDGLADKDTWLRAVASTPLRGALQVEAQRRQDSEALELLADGIRGPLLTMGSVSQDIGTWLSERNGESFLIAS